MKLALIFLILVFTKIYAYTQRDIVDAINTIAIENKVSPKILYTIIKIESDFNPFAISFLTDEQNAQYFKKLKTPNINILVSKYTLNTKKWVVSIRPINEYYAKEIARLLIRDGFSIDVGLGQINSVNFDTEELDYIFNPFYNLQKCAQVLRRCFDAKKGDLEYTIECYNYGIRDRKSNPYYKRFYEHYMKEFFN